LTVLLVLGGTAGCGDGGDADSTRPPAPARVALELDLDRSAAGAPDGGTQTGHRGGGYEAAVEGRILAVHGRVAPAGARVAVRGARADVRVARDGAFTVQLRDLPARAVVTVEASVGARRVREDVEIRRRRSAVPARREPQGVEPDRGPPGAAEPSGGRIDIDIRDFAFAPARVRARRGQQLVWRGQDAADHALRADGGPDDAPRPSSGRLGDGDRYDFTVRREGLYSYHCAIHPWMTGAIVAGP
jgi:plastocyanin